MGTSAWMMKGGGRLYICDNYQNRIMHVLGSESPNAMNNVNYKRYPKLHILIYHIPKFHYNPSDLYVIVIPWFDRLYMAIIHEL